MNVVIYTRWIPLVDLNSSYLRVYIMWGLALKILQWNSISQVILMQIVR